MPNALKKMMASFEASNTSSIKPLPPIYHQPPGGDHKMVFTEDESTETVPTLVSVKKQAKLPTIPSARSVAPPVSAMNPSSNYAFYINDSIPVATDGVNGKRLPEPLFELSKRDQMKAQLQIHRDIVENDINRTRIKPGAKLESDINVDYVLALTHNENRLFHQNSKLLNRIHDGYSEYIDQLLQRQDEPDSQLDEHGRQLAEASAQLKEKEDEAESTLRAIDALNDIDETEPEYRTIRVPVDPKYTPLTNDYVRLTHQIQNQLNKSKELASELESMATWNVNLEESLILEEQELNTTIATAKQIIDHASYDDDLAAIFERL